MNVRCDACLCAAALFFLSGCATSGRRESGNDIVVEVEGQAAENTADPSGARQRALAQAQRRAIERALGLSLRASTTVDRSIVVKQRLVADARGQIRRYQVIGEAIEGGLRKVRIRATVRRLSEGQTALAALPPERSVLAVTVRAAGSFGQEWEEEARGALEKGFLAAGFELNQPGEISAETIVVEADASAYQLFDARLSGFVSYRGRLSLTAVDNAGAVVWRHSQEASALGTDRRSAGAKALTEAARLAAQTTAEKLSAHLWKIR